MYTKSQIATVHLTTYFIDISPSVSSSWSIISLLAQLVKVSNRYAIFSIQLRTVAYCVIPKISLYCVFLRTSLKNCQNYINLLVFFCLFGCFASIFSIMYSPIVSKFSSLYESTAVGFPDGWKRGLVTMCSQHFAFKWMDVDASWIEDKIAQGDVVICRAYSQNS